MKDLMVFNNEMFGQIRVVDRDGVTWFVGKDVATALGYSDTVNAIKTHCRGVAIYHPIKDSLGREQDARIIPERDVYRLIMQSKLPSAERFEEWVVNEVIPSIRKHGAYLTPQTVEDILSNPDTLIRLATDLKEERARRIEAERTKAMIGSKREATAMAKASAAVRKVNQLEDQLGEGKNWKKVKAIPWLKDVFDKASKPYSSLGKLLKQLSVEMGYDIRTVEDSEYGNVNVYHVDVIAEMKDRIDSNDKILCRFRKESR